MKSSTNRALVAKKQSTFSAVMANSIKNLLQGYTKGIRLLLVMFLTLTVSAEVWGALSSPYECLFKTTSTLTNNQVTTGDVTWTLTTVTGKGSPTTTFGNTNGQSAIKLGSGKSNYYSKMTLKTSAFSAYNVSKVVLYISSNNGGKKTITVKQGDTQIGTVNQSFTSTTWVINCILNATKGSGGDLSIEISSDATATFIHSITVTYETAAPTTYTVTLNPNYPEGKTGVFKDKSNKTINGNLVLSYPSGTASMQITSLYNSLTLDGYDFGGWYNAKGINPGDVSGSSCTYTGNITGDKTYYAKWTPLPQYTVTWSVDGQTTTEQVYEGSKPTKAPTIDPANLPCDGADKFVGWTTGEYQGNFEPGILYPTANDIPAITEDKTFYAVFADYVNE